VVEAVINAKQDGLRSIPTYITLAAKTPILQKSSIQALKKAILPQRKLDGGICGGLSWSRFYLNCGFMTTADDCGVVSCVWTTNNRDIEWSSPVKLGIQNICIKLGQNLTHDLLIHIVLLPKTYSILSAKVTVIFISYPKSQLTKLFQTAHWHSKEAMGKVGVHWNSTFGLYRMQRI